MEHCKGLLLFTEADFQVDKLFDHTLVLQTDSKVNNYSIMFLNYFYAKSNKHHSLLQQLIYFSNYITLVLTI